MQIVPKKIFFTKGVGRHKEELRSFELALRDAGIEKCNLVQVSSIFPPKCKIVARKYGLEALTPGQITYCVLAKCSSNEFSRLIAASIGCAIPNDKNLYGYLSEHHAYGQTEKLSGDYAEDLAASMLATIIGVDFDPDASYDARKEIWKISGQIYRTTNSTETARGNARGKWTTVVTAVVFVS